MHDNTVWSIVVTALAAVIITICVSLVYRSAAETKAAAAAGLCQGTVPGYQGWVWTSCPAK